MVIIVSKEGQLANRIFHASSFIVNAKENHYRVCHLFFDDYYQFFSESLKSKKDLISFLGKRKTWLISGIQNVVTFLIRVLLKLKITRLPFIEIIDYRGYEQDKPAFDLNNQDFIRKAKSKLVFVYGWLFRDRVNEKKYRQLLIDIWQPNKNYVTNINNYWKRYKTNCDVLIGVHMRGGDYKKFEGGKWYYEPHQYYDKMKELARLDVFTGKKIGYVICTNERNVSFMNTDDFVVFHEERHFIEDLFLLSKCDYIIGPPSTFSGLASFYGQTPLYTITDINKQVSNELIKAKPIHFE